MASDEVTGSHDQGFKNAILDYPRQALELVAPIEAAALPPDAKITPARQEQLVQHLGDRYRETDTPLLVEFPNGEREAFIVDIEEETHPERFDVLRMAEYTIGLARLFKTTRVVPVALFVGSGEAPTATDLGVEEVFLHFHCRACRLAGLDAAQYWETDNVFAALNLTNMRHEPSEHMKVCEQSVNRYFELEPDEHKRWKYLPFIELEGRLTKPEVLHFRHWLAHESHWRTQVQNMWEDWTAEAVAKAEAKGEAKGKAEGEASALLLVLSRRRIRLTAAQRKTVQECRDLATLRRWLERSLEAKSAAEVFESVRH
jgi:hypothetical protein